MTGTGPAETAAWLPRRALVLGLARSGNAAALALARRGVSVLAADRSAGVDASRLSAAGVEFMLPLANRDTLDLLGLAQSELEELCVAATGFMRHVLDQVQDEPETLGLPGPAPRPQPVYV